MRPLNGAIENAKSKSEERKEKGAGCLWEFPDVETVKTWYQSEEYAPLLKLRKEISNNSIILIKDGITLAD